MIKKILEISDAGIRVVRVKKKKIRRALHLHLMLEKLPRSGGPLKESESAPGHDLALKCRSFPVNKQIHRVLLLGFAHILFLFFRN